MVGGEKDFRITMNKYERKRLFNTYASSFSLLVNEIKVYACDSANNHGTWASDREIQAMAEMCYDSLLWPESVYPMLTFRDYSQNHTHKHESH
jgi:hypothetical protein